MTKMTTKVRLQLGQQRRRPERYVRLVAQAIQPLPPTPPLKRKAKPEPPLQPFPREMQTSATIAL